jgi:hypothetical protein
MCLTGVGMYHCCIVVNLFYYCVFVFVRCERHVLSSAPSPSVGELVWGVFSTVLETRGLTAWEPIKTRHDDPKESTTKQNDSSDFWVSQVPWWRLNAIAGAFSYDWYLALDDPHCTPRWTSLNSITRGKKFDHPFTWLLYGLTHVEYFCHPLILYVTASAEDWRSALCLLLKTGYGLQCNEYPSNSEFLIKLWNPKLPHMRCENHAASNTTTP